MKKPTIIHDQVIGEELIQEWSLLSNSFDRRDVRVHDVLTANRRKSNENDPVYS